MGSKSRRVPKNPTVKDVVAIVGNARISVLQQAARKLGMKLEFSLEDAPAPYPGDAIAFRLRAELVCCDIYDRVNIRRELTLRQAMDSPGWHDLCYWGEASARLAEGRCPGYETVPNICRCSCSGCAVNCRAHVDEGGAEQESVGSPGTEVVNVVPLCRCGHAEEQHLGREETPEPQCKVCPEDGEKMWVHPFTPQSEQESRCD